jgi:hypothetical protein
MLTFLKRRAMVRGVALTTQVGRLTVESSPVGGELPWTSAVEVCREALFTTVPDRILIQAGVARK